MGGPPDAGMKAAGYLSAVHTQFMRYLCNYAFAYEKKIKHYARYAKTQCFYRLKSAARSARDLPHGASPSHRRASIHSLAHPQREDRRSFGQTHFEDRRVLRREHRPVAGPCGCRACRQFRSR
ncbi:hypothetical protein EMIT0P171_60109 [Pseudomonas sp. IT-P171]